MPLAPKKSEEYNEGKFETAAKMREKDRLRALPEPGQGKKCFRCGLSIWHNKFMDHMNEHLDFHNNGMGKYINKLQAEEKAKLTVSDNPANLVAVTNKAVFDQNA